MPRLEVIVAGVLLSLFAAMVITAAGYPPAARLVPLVVGIPSVILAAFQLWRDVRASPESREATGRTEGEAAAAVSALAGFASFVLLVIAFGFVIGGTLAVIASQRVWLHESWRTALIGGIVSFILLEVVMGRWMGLVLFEGLVPRWIA